MAKEFTSKEINKLERLFKHNLLDLQIHKIKWVLTTPSYLIGCFGTILRYGFEMNEQTWRIFIEVIGEKLSSNKEIEYEFEEEEYTNLLSLKELPTFVK